MSGEQSAIFRWNWRLWDGSLGVRGQRFCAGWLAGQGSNALAQCNGFGKWINLKFTFEQRAQVLKLAQCLAALPLTSKGSHELLVKWLVERIVTQPLLGKRHHLVHFSWLL